MINDNLERFEVLLCAQVGFNYLHRLSMANVVAGDVEYGPNV